MADSRARRRGREELKETYRESNGDSRSGDSDDQPADGNATDATKKRRRSRRSDLDKKFDCKHEGCGKAYSRAEHLYRHQLNHNPKQIYRCDFPDCYRSFVRQDLCVRHRERHTTHGSQLQKKRDSFTNISKDITMPQPYAHEGGPSVENSTQGGSRGIDGAASPTAVSSLSFATSKAMVAAGTPTYMHHSGVPSAGSSSTVSLEPQLQPLTPPTHYAPSETESHIKRESVGTFPLSPQKAPHIGVYPALRRPSMYVAQDGQGYHHQIPFSPPNIVPAAPPNSTGAGGLRHFPFTTTASGNYSTSQSSNTLNRAAPSLHQHSYVDQQSLQMSSLPSPGYSNQVLTHTTSSSIAEQISGRLARLDPVADALSQEAVIPDAMPDLEAMQSYAHPIFGGESTLNRSPFAMTDDFTAWLFNDHVNASSLDYSSVPSFLPHFSDPVPMQLQNQYYPHDGTFAHYFGTNIVQPQHPMSVTSIIDSVPPQSMISEEKRNELLDLIQSRFNGSDDHAGTKSRKDSFLEGNIDADNHLLSLRMMQTYIGSYWQHCHDQLPVLHKPTFSADKTPNLLLLAVMAIGGATLDKGHGLALRDGASDFANFVVWHLRWEIFQDADFRPPAKLWVFQTLLLLEVYEKMYSTRVLHERAHIHHDTTLTLMRRGSSLIDRPANDSPPSLRDDRQNRSATACSGSNSASDYGAGDESWAQWIKAEATRRVAFGAFVLDTTHATMFGHSAKMVAHEMLLPLPCDEALWSATSAAEVARVQANLHSNGVKPIMFLEALKKTLNGQRVRTNTFGRTVLMAGLLSVSWHMNQRDLQVSSLGVVQALGGRDKWRSALIRAFDNWKRDIDEACGETFSSSATTPSPRTPNNSTNNNCGAYRQQSLLEDDVLFECRTVLHHLAHMASHADVVDCQIFAGAGRLLGRSITTKDYSNAREKMTHRWARKASARDAAFYALKFLSEVLLIPSTRRSSSATTSSSAYNNNHDYSARDDYLLNRPWVLYFAALVVWCYGYALDGPITPSPPPALLSRAEQQRDMYDFLERVGGVRSPDDLDHIRDRNRCMGLLTVLRESFRDARWELLREAANLLGSCIEKLKGPTNNANISAS